MLVRGFEKHEEFSRAATVISEFNKLFQGLDVDLSHIAEYTIHYL